MQLPLPAHIAEEEVIKAIDPAKDVDGFHPVNLGKMVQGQPGFIPATPMESCYSWNIFKLIRRVNMPW